MVASWYEIKNKARKRGKGEKGGRAYSVEPLDGILGDVDGAEVSDQLVGEDGEDVVKFLDGIGHC